MRTTGTKEDLLSRLATFLSPYTRHNNAISKVGRREGTSAGNGKLKIELSGIEFPQGARTYILVIRCQFSTVREDCLSARFSVRVCRELFARAMRFSQLEISLELMEGQGREFMY